MKVNILIIFVTRYSTESNPTCANCKSLRKWRKMVLISASSNMIQYDTLSLKVQLYHSPPIIWKNKIKRIYIIVFKLQLYHNSVEPRRIVVQWLACSPRVWQIVGSSISCQLYTQWLLLQLASTVRNPITKGVGLVQN
jgi:hypothetical protein